MKRCLITFLACSVFLVSVLACTKTPKFHFSQGTRVGFINLLEPDATHTNFSSLGTNSFTKKYAVNWDMPSYAERKLVDELKKNANLTIVKIKVADELKTNTLRLEMIQQVLLSETVPPTIPPIGAGLLNTISDPYNVHVIIILGNYSGPSPYKSADDPIQFEGYGLFTRSLFKGIFRGFLSFRKAYAFAQIGVVVYKAQPVIYIGAARTSSKGRPLLPLSDFDWKANIKNLPASELDKTRPKIQEYIDAAVNKALINANLAASRSALKDTESGIGGAPSR